MSQVENLVISQEADESRTVRLRDVASVQMGYEDATRLLRLNGQETVNISIAKTSGSNEIQVANDVKSVLAELKTSLPAGAGFTIVTDDSSYTQESVNGVQEDLILAILVTGLVMLVFLHTFRSTLIVVLAIPTSLIATFLVMWGVGFSLNTLTLLALTLVIGILVDDSIVVIENIERHLKQGDLPKLAALNGRSEIGLAAITITLVDVVTYVPVAFTTGMIGQLFRSYGITIAVATMWSLVVSFTLTPMLASVWLRNESEIKQRARGVRRALGVLFFPASFLWQLFTRGWNAGFAALERAYGAVIHFALRNILTEGLVLLIAAVAMAWGISLVTSGAVGTEFAPQEDDGQISVSITMPAGTSLAATDQAARQAETIIRRDVPEAVYILTDVGSTSSMMGSSGLNQASITIRLVDKGQRARSTTQIIAPLRQELKRIPEALATVSLTSSMGGGGAMAGLEIDVQGDDAGVLVSLANQVAALMSFDPGRRRRGQHRGGPGLRDQPGGRYGPGDRTGSDVLERRQHAVHGHLRPAGWRPPAARADRDTDRRAPRAGGPVQHG